jgi:hypothetical protein
MQDFYDLNAAMLYSSATKKSLMGKIKLFWTRIMLRENIYKIITMNKFGRDNTKYGSSNFLRMKTNIITTTHRRLHKRRLCSNARCAV